MWKASEISFRQEYGAEVLSVSSGSWVKRTEFFVNSTCEKLVPRECNCLGHPGKRYGALDLALTNDGAVVAVCHKEAEYIRDNLVQDDPNMSNKNVVVFDYIDYLYPEGGKPTRISAVADIMIKAMGYYHLDAFYLDNWSFEMFKQYLEDRGKKDDIRLLEILRVINPTQTTNSDWARVFRTVLVEGRMAYPNDELLLGQVSALREKVVGRSYSKVENTSGHDDIPNAMFKAVYYCEMDVKVDEPVVSRRTESTRGMERWRKTLDARSRKGNNILFRR
jgi:hypothetical protein